MHLKGQEILKWALLKQSWPLVLLFPFSVRAWYFLADLPIRHHNFPHPMSVPSRHAPNKRKGACLSTRLSACVVALPNPCNPHAFQFFFIFYFPLAQGLWRILGCTGKRHSIFLLCRDQCMPWRCLETKISTGAHLKQSCLISEIRWMQTSFRFPRSALFCCSNGLH